MFEQLKKQPVRGPHLRLVDSAFVDEYESKYLPEDSEVEVLSRKGEVLADIVPFDRFFAADTRKKSEDMKPDFSGLEEELSAPSSNVLKQPKESGKFEDLEEVVELDEMVLPPSIAAAGTVLEADLVLSEDATVDSVFRGSIDSSGVLVLGTLAEVEAQIAAEELVIYGFVDGDIYAEKVTIKPGATVLANISCAKLKLEPGAVFEGECSMG